MAEGEFLKVLLFGDFHKLYDGSAIKLGSSCRSSTSDGQYSPGVHGWSNTA